MTYFNRGIIFRPNLFPKSNKTFIKSLKLSVSSLPNSVDWREKNLVVPIKNQGQCGNCWTFSAVNAIEGQYSKTNGQLLTFSEQQLTDCVYLSQGKSGSNADGCNGGWMSEAFDYLEKSPGLSQEKDYPLKSQSTGKVRI